MDCAEARKLIVSSYDSPSDAAGPASLAAHLAGCAKCREEKARFDALDAGLAITMGAAPPPSIDRPEVYMTKKESFFDILKNYSQVAAIGAVAFAAFLAFVIMPAGKPDIQAPSAGGGKSTDYELRIVEKSVTVRDGASEAGAAREAANGFLNERDRVVTDDFGQAELVYRKDSVLKIKQNSSVEIGAGGVRVAVGKIWVNYKRSGGEFKVVTPSATIGIRGTRFSVDVRKDGKTAVALYEGSLAVENGRGKVDIAAGEQAVCEVDRAPAAVRGKPVDEDIFIKTK